MKNKLSKKTLLAASILFAASFGFAQSSGAASLTAKDCAAQAAKKDSLEQSVEYLKKNVTSLTPASEKRAGLAFLGSVQEQMGNYSDALNSYAQAAAIAAGDAAGMPKKSSEQLVIDAVRCALSAGDWSTAQNYLNSAVRSSTNATIAAYVKLYEQWSILCKASKLEDTAEAVAMLKTYSTLDSMKAVRPQLLLTLWHITGEKTYSESLKKDFPKSLEASIVKGEVQTLPAPFWYFVPRSSTTAPEVEQAATKVSESATSTAAATTAGDAAAAKKTADNSAAGTSGSERKSTAATESSSEKITRQQLGLFRDKANADALVEKLKEKKFDAKITTEKRPSGTTYYIVVVDENKEGTIGDQLRTAGFECYPVFE